eukprot:CAMPEP_0180389108 /NCGR_PEP_ID=MMETSP0989-20121125/31214_1 /TAXON_ID=697907 /ORGANISM="non described non described, Strain CCMP2293" /LENGTH=72 /DNA_ID=CAMNT_0022390251 /DNA_START=11 /DNA_END=225 /DNA_ORIENTATION=-
MAKRKAPSGKLSKAAREAKDAEFTGTFFCRFFSCIGLAVVIVSVAFVVMNEWLDKLPQHSRGAMIQPGTSKR